MNRLSHKIWHLLLAMIRNKKCRGWRKLTIKIYLKSVSFAHAWNPGPDIAQALLVFPYRPNGCPDLSCFHKSLLNTKFMCDNPDFNSDDNFLFLKIRLRNDYCLSSICYILSPNRETQGLPGSASPFLCVPRSNNFIYLSEDPSRQIMT